MSINYFNFNKEEKSMKENEKLRLEEDVRENANSQEEKTTTEENVKEKAEAVEEKKENESNSEEKNEEDENEKEENSSTRKILIFSIVGVVVVALVIVLCIVFANSARKNKQEEVTNQQTAIEEEAEEQPTTIKEEVADVEEESTPKPTEEPTPEPTAEPVEMVSWEEWASQPGEEEPHLVVWNEEEGKQLIIEPDSTYTMEDGDKLAVSASMSIENLNEMSAVVIIKEGDFTKQNIVATDYGQYWEIDIQKEGKNKIDYDFKDEEYGYIVVK